MPDPNAISLHCQSVVASYRGDRTELLGILREVQQKWRHIPDAAIGEIADALDVPRIHVEGVAGFYHFFSKEHRGLYSIYLNTSATAEMSGAHAIREAFERELGIPLGSTSADLQFGFYKTSCIGMCDQEPAVLINGEVFTSLTPERVMDLVAGMKAGVAIKDLKRSSPWSEVKNTVRRKGPVIFSDYVPGQALARAMELGSVDVIELVKASGLRGRGGAGFPTGTKWAFCRAAPADERTVICNVDEGEPGTFKDRALLTENAEAVFEAMAIAGYAVEARNGILYLRDEYAYLRDRLEAVLAQMRSQNRLGRKILGTRFSFDIRIKQGAGAYICGEESALIESAEGKRGQPRNRPPYPVTSGYLHRPTIVNNPETLLCALKIVGHGPEWFRKWGTPASPGVKLLSIAGDCQWPGIYEVEWGISVREVLELCGARDVLAVQVGGPSGTCVSERQFDRKLCYSDLATGGAFTVFGKHRDLFSIVHNHMEFFVEESCGFCVPCRAGNTLLLKALEKIMVGNGTSSDIQSIRELGKTVKLASRCGLGQTSPNPLLTTIENFAEAYSSQVRDDVDYLSQFSLSHAVADACAAAGRKPGLEAEAAE